MATKTISGNGSKGHHRFYLSLSNTLLENSLIDNESLISFNFYIMPIANGGWNWEQWGANISYVIFIDGVKYTGTIPNYDGYSTLTIRSDTLRVKHENDGTKNLSFNVRVTDTSGQSYTCGDVSLYSSMELETIPRYLKIHQLLIQSKTETDAVVYWLTSDARDSTYYSLDNGNTWIGSATYGEGMTSDSRMGIFNIKNLTANTRYNLKVKFKRTDTQLWTESEVVTFTTYNYPHCTNSHDFTIGEALTLDFYNPLSRAITVRGYAKSDGSEIFSGETTSDKLVGFNNNNSVNAQYASIPNAQSGEYKVVVFYGDISSTKEKAGVYRIVGNEVPTINELSYTDGNSSVVAITGDSTQIVQNKSVLKANIQPATANRGASGITRYIVECNGISKTVNNSGLVELGVINSARDVDLKLTVYDSRGLSASKTITIKMVAYETPTARVELERLNNYEDETYLTVDGTVASVLGKNTMTIQYRYKLKSGSFGSFTTISDNTKQTLSLDKNNTYVVNVVVTDRFGETFNGEFVLNKGVFPLFIDTVKNSVGINCFPTGEKSFEVEGGTKTAHFCGVINSAHWYHIGDFTFNGQGTCAVVDCYTGKGQNGGADQNTHLRIMLKQGWDGEASPIGVTANFTQNYQSGIKVKISHIGKTGCKLYMYLPFTYTDLSYTVDGSYKSFSASNTVLDEEPTTDKESHYYNNTNQGNKVLWSGGMQMNASQTVSLNEAVSAQPHGIVLVFSRCDASNGTPLEWGWTTHFVPKAILTINAEKSGQTFMMSDNALFESVCCKYLYIGDTAIGGNANNIKAGTANGITYANNAHMLRAVIGV